MKIFGIGKYLMVCVIYDAKTYGNKYKHAQVKDRRNFFLKQKKAKIYQFRISDLEEL